MRQIHIIHEHKKHVPDNLSYTMNFTVALVFWGLTRSLSWTVGSIEQHIFAPLVDHGIRYHSYIHTYTLMGPYSNPRSHEADYTLNFTEYVLLNPTAWKIEAMEDVDRHLHLEKYMRWTDPWANNYSSVKNHVRALYSLMQATLLVVNAPVAYDAVVALRPDVFYLNDLNIPELLSIKPRTLYIPDFHLIAGVNDRFAFGSPGAMKVYGTRYLHAELYVTRKGLHSENFLRHVLDANGIATEQVHFRFRRMRATKRLWDGDVKA